MVRAEAERLAGDGGEERLARQQQAIRFNHRVDPASGMIEFWGKLDPLRGHEVPQPAEGTDVRAVRRQDARRLPVRPGREERLPAGARACSTCASEAAGGAARPEVIVVVDTRDTSGG